MTMQQKVTEKELMERLMSKSRLTKKDADEISDIIDKEVAKKLGL